MGIYSTVFVATDAQLRRLANSVYGFDAVRENRQGVNPFTKQPMTIPSWRKKAAARGEGLFRKGPHESVRPPISVEMGLDADPEAGFYAKMMEDAAPAALRCLPHESTKSVTQIELDALAETIVGKPCPPAVAADLGDKTIFESLAREAIAPLALLDDAALDEVSGRWLKALADRGDATWILRVLRRLAQLAQAENGHVCVHVRTGINETT